MEIEGREKDALSGYCWDISVLHNREKNCFSNWYSPSPSLLNSRETDLINKPCKCSDCESDPCEANKYFTVNCQGRPATLLFFFTQKDCLLSSCLVKACVMYGPLINMSLKPVFWYASFETHPMLLFIKLSSSDSSHY